MKVVKNNPVPAPVPPTTYTISDISERQMKALRAVVQGCGSADPIEQRTLSELYASGFTMAVFDAVPR